MEKILTLAEIREIQNRMLMQFDEYCRERGFAYSLWAGTLLGAVRHKGHIPWDDDVDVIMPRADYEELLKSYYQNPIEGIRLVSYENTEKYYYPFAKLSDVHTDMKEDNVEKQDYGIYIDIFPLEELPANEKKAAVLTKKCRVAFYLLFLNLQQKNVWGGWRGLANNLILKPIAKMIPRKKFSSYMEDLIKKQPVAFSGKVTVLTHSSLAKKSVAMSDVFPTQKTAFESMQLCVPQKYSVVLSSLYGDYMTPPSAAQQVAKHNTRVWRVESK